jgi:hypothetical protein
MVETQDIAMPNRRVTRTKTVDVIPLGGDVYRLEARLTDLSRGGDYGGSASADSSEVSVIHDIAITALVRGPELELVELHVRPLTMPYETCPFVVPTLKELIGTKLTSGWRQSVLERSSGTRGCTHINTLLLGLSEMQVLVIFLKMNERVAHTPSTRASGEWMAAGQEVAPQLTDVCFSLRGDGPVLKAAQAYQAQH